MTLLKVKVAYRRPASIVSTVGLGHHSNTGCLSM